MKTTVDKLIFITKSISGTYKALFISSNVLPRAPRDNIAKTISADIGDIIRLLFGTAAALSFKVNQNIYNYNILITVPIK